MSHRAAREIAPVFPLQNDFRSPSRLDQTRWSANEFTRVEFSENCSKAAQNKVYTSELIVPAAYFFR